MKFNIKTSIILAGGLVIFVMILLFLRTSNNTPPQSDLTPTNIPEMIDSERYTHPEQGYSIMIPEGYRVDQLSEYSINILPAVDVIGMGPTNFIYVSVVTPEMRDNQGDIYNYNPDHYQKLISLDQVGQTTNFAEDDNPDLADWFEYTLVGIEDFENAKIKRFENTNPWEFPAGTTETRYIYDTGENIYILGYYTGGDGVEEEASIDPREAFDIIKSFNK